MKKSEQLGLSFPYDWSNPNIPDISLILNVLDRGIFEDICRICTHYGLPVVLRQHQNMMRNAPPRPSLVRMLAHIEEGFSRAQTKPSASSDSPRI